jgi:hypothetical protein
VVTQNERFAIVEKLLGLGRRIAYETNPRHP